MELELRHLKVVCALADEGSVTKAAASLGLAQPALTAQLNRIEKSLGGTLFERDHRGVRSTALGDLVLARARVMLPAMSGLKEEAARLTSNEGRDGAMPSHVTLGSSTSVVLGRLIRSLAVEHPDLHVATHASWSSDGLADMVVDGRVDFAVVGVCADASPPAQHGLSWHTVTSDPVFVLLPEHHPLASRAEVGLPELAGEDWAAIPVDGCFTGCFAAACARAGFTPRTLYEADAASCIDLVASGHAVGWHPDAAAAVLADEIVRLTTDAFAGLMVESPVYSAWLQGRTGFGIQPLPPLSPAV